MADMNKKILGPKAYALALSKKDKDRLTQRDKELLERFPELAPEDSLRKLSLEEKIIKKIRERAPKKKMGGIMKAKFGRSIQDPKTSKGESLRDKIKKTLPKTKEGMPVGGKMKKPKPGSYDYQLESTMKPSYKGMNMGGGMMKKPMGYNKGIMMEKEKSNKIKDAYRRSREEKPERRITKEDIKIEKLSVGGMCRGMGAAIKGGKFGGVK